MTKYPDSKLNNHQNLKELLKVTTETTKKILKCDRVMIYDASEMPKALIIAGTTDSQYPSILGQTIKDPFLEDDYLEMYCYGHAVVIDDIYQADKSQSQLEDLEKLEIKSLAIAPMTVENKLVSNQQSH